MKNLIKKSSDLLKPVVGVFIVCFFIFYMYPTTSPRLTADFLFSFIGILLGFALTTFTFIVSMVDKIRDKAQVKFTKDKSKFEEVERKIKRMYEELKDDIYFIFISLLIVSTSFINFSEPLNAFNLDLNTIQQFKISAKATIFLLCLYAIYDLIATSFSISNSTAILEDKEAD